MIQMLWLPQVLVNIDERQWPDEAWAVEHGVERLMRVHAADFPGLEPHPKNRTMGTAKSINAIFTHQRHMIRQPDGIQ